MPTYIRPKFATVEPGGGEWIGMLVMVAVAVLVIGSLVAFVMAHIVLLACCVAGIGVVLGSFAAWSRWISSPKRLAELREAERAELPAATPAVALPRGWSASAPRALPRPVEYHVHLHGVSCDDVAAIVNRRES
jgi:Na+-transporting methylmalonyl-CoA/oxaloacetate decarboxylase gamma subunit